MVMVVIVLMMIVALLVVVMIEVIITIVVMAVVVMIMCVCWNEQVLLFILLVQLTELWRGRARLTVHWLRRDSVQKTKTSSTSVTTEILVLNDLPKDTT